MRHFSKEQTEYAVSCLVGICQSRDIKQTELERMSNVDQSTISKTLRSRDNGEKYTPSPEVLQKLFQALGIKLSDILNESEHLAEEIVGYLATPLTGLTPKEDEEVRRIVVTVRKLLSEFTNPRFEVYWPGDHTHPTEHAAITAAQVYVIDRSRASTHDFIILFCAAPSYGVGQENEIATQAGVPAIRIVPPAGLSRMMQGSFVRALDVPYSGDLRSRVTLAEEKLRNALEQIRNLYFRSRAFYHGINGDVFGKRLRNLVDQRCGADYIQFAADIGVSLEYLHKMMDEPFRVSNPSALLLKRAAHRLGERAAFLLGEGEVDDPIWVQSNASWRSWIQKTRGLDAQIVLQMRDDWRSDYAEQKREMQGHISSRSANLLMHESDWDIRYQQLNKKGMSSAKHGGEKTANLPRVS